MALQLRTGPATEPVSLEETKSFLRIDDDDNDIMVSSLITAARIYIETTIGKSLLTQNWSYFLDKWPNSGTIYLPLSPVQSIDQIKIHGITGTEETLNETEYQTDIYSANPRIKLTGTHNLAVNGQSINKIEVMFTAGFGLTAEEVPADLKQALLMLAAHWFENREPIGFGAKISELPTTIQSILANHKKYRIQ